MEEDKEAVLVQKAFRKVQNSIAIWDNTTQGQVSAPQNKSTATELSNLEHPENKVFHFYGHCCKIEH